MSGMLDTWHLPEAKLLFRILLNSSAFLFNEHSSFGQVCGKYFCEFCVCFYPSFFSDPWCQHWPCKSHWTLWRHILDFKNGFKVWVLALFCLGIFLWSPVITVWLHWKSGILSFFWCWLEQIVLHLFHFQLTYMWGKYYLYSLSYKINVLK